MRSLPTLLAVGLVAVPVHLTAGEREPGKLDPRMPYRARKSNPVTYKVDFSAVVTPPYKAKVLKVWMPVPPTDSGQEVSGSRFSTFPVRVKPKVGTEKVHGNTFAYFEFRDPKGAQVVRHRFTVKVWQLDWDVDPARVARVERWPDSFHPYLRGEPLIPVGGRFKELAGSIVKERSNPARDLARVMDWANANLTYTHDDCSLQGSALHALEKKGGHCSDYHGLCSALGRALGYPTRIVYGINPYPKNSPSHCKLEAFLPPYGWVAFDVSETQQLLARIEEAPGLKPDDKAKLAKAARRRLARGFRDNTWFLQTRGSDYELEPRASRKVAVVRTIFAEADGVPYPEPDPANPKERAFSWMTVHAYEADRAVPNPYEDWRTLPGRKE
jgi:transglutaminase-like putative cysteine protease